MKKAAKKTMASILLSTGLAMNGLTVGILADETEDPMMPYTPITTMTDPQAFIDMYLSRTVYDTVYGTSYLQIIQVVDETNYALILSGKSVYDTYTYDVQVMIDNAVYYQTGKTYSAYVYEAQMIQNQVLAETQQPENTAQPAPEENTEVTTEPETQAQEQPEVKTEPETPVLEQPEEKEEISEKEESSEKQESVPEVKAEQKKEKSEEESELAEPEEKVEVEQPAEKTATGLSGSASYQGVRVDVSAPADAFEEGTTLTITPMVGPSIDNAVKNATGRKDDTGTIGFEITFYDKEGKEVQPAKEVQVTFTVEAETPILAKNSTLLQIYHMETPASAAQAVSSPVSIDPNTGSAVTVQVNSFSLYVVDTVEQAVLEQPLANHAPAQPQNEQVEAKKTQKSSTAQEFVDENLTDGSGNVYSSANASNYIRIMNAATAWNALTTVERAQVNSILTQDVNKTYNHLLYEAKQIYYGGNVQTGVSTSEAMYTILMGASVIGLIAVMDDKRRMTTQA